MFTHVLSPSYIFTESQGFTVFALAFVYSSSTVDNAALWTQLSAAQRASIKSEYNAAGISLIVSAFGAGPNPTSAGDDPTAAANFIANYVKTYGLDGVDVDYEVGLDHNLILTFTLN
jgi:chitinase